MGSSAVFFSGESVVVGVEYGDVGIVPTVVGVGPAVAVV